MLLLVNRFFKRDQFLTYFIPRSTTCVKCPHLCNSTSTIVILHNSYTTKTWYNCWNNHLTCENQTNAFKCSIRASSPSYFSHVIKYLLYSCRGAHGIPHTHRMQHNIERESDHRWRTSASENAGFVRHKNTPQTRDTRLVWPTATSAASRGCSLVRYPCMLSGMTIFLGWALGDKHNGVEDTMTTEVQIFNFCEVLTCALALCVDHRVRKSIAHRSVATTER